MAKYHEDNREEITQKAYAYNKQMSDMVQDKGVSETVKYYYKLIDSITRETKMSKSMSCGDGCGMCCIAEIPVNSFEAIYIKDVVKGKCLSDDRLSIQKKTETYNDLNFMQRQCTLLSNGSCTIYENRPLVCRSHNSIDNPKYCDRTKYPDKKLNRAYNLDIEAIQVAFSIISRNTSTELHKLIEK